MDDKRLEYIQAFSYSMTARQSGETILELVREVRQMRKALDVICLLSSEYGVVALAQSVLNNPRQPEAGNEEKEN